MSRLILLVVVVVAVYWLLKSYLKQSGKPAVPQASEEMVRCVQCGVHVPQGEGVLSNGEYFCSEAHRAEHVARNKSS